MEFQNLQELSSLVAQNQGVITVSMRSLKDAAKQGESLKKYVREKISNELRKVGLAHTEEELPNSQSTHVRVYQLGSHVASILDAARQTDEEGRYDEILRKAAANNQAELLTELKELREDSATLDKIREILQCNE